MRPVAVIASAIALAAVAAGSSSGGGSAVVAPGINACYSAQFTAFVPRTLTLSDAFAGAVTVRIDYADTVCTSAPGSSSDFLTCFHVLSAKRARATAVRLARAAASLWTVGAIRAIPSSLCFAAAHVERGPVPKPSRNVGPYTCYGAKTIRVAASTKGGVAVKDIFGLTTDKLVRASRLCAPATKAGSTKTSQVYLACYAIDSDTLGKTVIVRNELALMRATPGPRDELCAAARPG